jgi:hypothetical protein
MKRRNVLFVTLVAGITLAGAGCQSTASRTPSRIYSDAGLGASDSLGGAVFSGANGPRQANVNGNSERFDRAAAVNGER